MVKMEGSHASPSGHRTSLNACLACRKIKTKCEVGRGTSKCERCTRNSLECVFQQHRRGRRPGTRLSSTADRASRALPKKRRVVEAESDNTTALTTTSTQNQQPARNVGTGAGTTSVGAQQTSQSDFWAESEGFQPPDLLSKQAMEGKFSLLNVLSTNHAPPTRPENIPPAALTEDPLHLGLLNQPIAISLFDGFMQNLNPFIAQLDPSLHTFSYVRQKSSFLLSAMLATAAKALNPSFYAPLQAHTDRLFTESFRRGKKSTEDIQAILILTYWKEPDDSRVWLSIGYAIRMCMELGWHKLGLNKSKRPETDTERREARNIERTWLLLFVYDRSLSLQTGKPWMIERSEFIESVEDWYHSPLASPNDGLLCAFVTLRLMTSEVFELLRPHQQPHHIRQLYHVEALLKIINSKVEKWQAHWLSSMEAGPDRCHPFLIQFYGTHTRLLLFSIPLHVSLSSSAGETSIDTRALWTSYSSAIEMLKLVTHPSNSPLLYFAQDSVHVMTAYAAVFLIKLLLSVPRSIRSEIEVCTVDTIVDAARMFAEQSASPNTGCALQANFLRNVAREYEKIRQQRPTGANAYSRDASNNKVGSQPVPQQPSSSQMPPIASRSVQHNFSSLDEGNLRSSDMFEPGLIQRNDNRSHLLPLTSAMSLNSDNHHNEEPIHDVASGQAYTPITTHTEDFAFTDDEMWATMFANAGFSINEGMFLPEVCG